MHRLLRSLAFGAVVASAVPSATTQTPQFKTYRDRTHGVTFRYPAAWKADPKLAFYLGTSILISPEPGTEANEPLMKVGFKRTPGADGAFPDNLNLDGLEFVYLVLPQATADACYARLTDQEDDAKKSEVVIHGVTFKRLQGGDAGLGHGAYRDIYVSYLGKLCYLFEGGVHTANGNNTKFLQGKSLLELQNQLADVMRSVTIDFGDSN